VWSANHLFGQLLEWFYYLTQTVVWAVRLGSYGVSSSSGSRHAIKLTDMQGLLAVRNLCLMLSLFIRMVFLIPRLVKEALAEVPDILVNFICDVLRVYGFDDVCPE
jgi:hypothetical protein